MTLSPEDGKLFYQLWLPLLDYVNKKYKVERSLKNIATATHLDCAKTKSVANALWDNVDIIDEYLAAHTDMPKRHREILSSWKRALSGRFILERHLKKGSMLICAENENVYQVCGIVSSPEEMFYGAPMPLLIEATLIPFENVIITDGLIVPYSIYIGPNMARNFKDQYMAAKNAHG